MFFIKFTLFLYCLDVVHETNSNKYFTIIPICIANSIEEKKEYV